MTARDVDDMNDRTCIVTGQKREADELIRFVAGPDGMVVPDIRRKLPGRGCWVTADRATVEKAAARNHFRRSMKQDVTVPADLGGQVDMLLAGAAIQALAMARKAGKATSGAMQVEKALRSGKAIAVLHAIEAAADGIRKLDQARRATVHLGGPDAEVFSLFGAEQMGLAFGSGHVIHAAVLDGGAGHAALRQIELLAAYRAGSTDGHGA